MITQKRVDLTEELFKSGVGFEAMPLHDVVLPYAEADVLACAGVYQSQMADFKKEENKSLTNITDLMNEMLMFCVECEQNGIKISEEALDAVEREYAAEKEQIEARLDLLVKEVMGDTPINLASGQDMTKVIYSREIIDRERHIKTWNVGTDANGKAKFAPRALSKREGFLRALNNTTKFIEKIPPGALFLPPLSAIGEGFYKQQSLQTSLVFSVDDGAVKTKTKFQFIEGKNGKQLNQFSGTADAKLLDLSSFNILSRTLVPQNSYRFLPLIFFNLVPISNR